MSSTYGNLSNENHNQMDAFLERVLDAYSDGQITKENTISGLAHVMAALDKGNTAEAIAWFNQDGVNNFL